MDLGEELLPADDVNRLESLADAVVVVDAAGRILSVNTRAETLFGYRRAQLLGRPVEQLLPERFRPAHLRSRAAYRAAPEFRPMGAGRLNLYGRRQDGSEVPVEVSLIPLQHDGSPPSFAATIRERTAPAAFGSFLESAPDAVVVIDRDGVVTRVNAQTERLFGFSRLELLGRPVERLMPERVREAHVRHRVAYRSDPRFRPMGAARLSLYGLRKDGTEFPVEISLSPFETDDGLFFAATIRDLVAQTRHSAGSAGSTLLATKLRPPPPPANVVSRPRLVHLVDEAAERNVTLLSAPIGSGKTTLLRAWSEAAAKHHLVAWLSLDGTDNDPRRFWSCAVMALRDAGIIAGDDLLTARRGPGVPATAGLTQLINQLGGSARPAVLVLDDYHLITNRQIDEQMAFLVTHLPGTLRLVVASRADPPWPLARLRVRGELSEVRAGDLCFTEAEAGALLNATMGLDLSAGDVARLHQRTEGWAAGLHLAGLSLQGRSDRRAFIDGFAGDDRNVVDYLWPEVLRGVPGDEREFLVRTSVLQRLCGPLCDAVTGTTGSARRLEELERGNWFVVPLDSKRRWYRYHHLFAELLQAELRRTEPELVATLHHRASVWYEEAGAIGEALGHANAAGETSAAAALIGRHWTAFVDEGRGAAVLGWLDALPRDTLLSEAPLCLARAAVAVFLGEADADRWLAATDDAARSGGASAVEAAVATLRAIRLRLAGELTEAADEARRARKLEAEASPWRALTAVALGSALYWLGERGEAKAVLEEAVRSGEAAGQHLAVVWAQGHLAAISCDDGDVARGEELSREALARSEVHGLSDHYVAAIANLTLGRILARNGLLREAEGRVRRGVELARRCGAPAPIAYGLLTLAGIRGPGGRGEVAGLVEEARSLLERHPDLGIVAELVRQAEHEFSGGDQGPTGEDGSELTDQERAILGLLSSDLTQRDIAATLFISRNTVKTHTRSIYRKLVVSSRSEAVARARELRIP